MIIVLLGGDTLLGHHILHVLGALAVNVISFLPESQAIYFQEHYPRAKFAFLPQEPLSSDAVEAFLKLHPSITHIIFLGPHCPPTAAELAACNRNLGVHNYELSDTALETDGFASARRKIHNWLHSITSTNYCSKADIKLILESSVWACDADDKVFCQKWKCFTHRDICLVTYKQAVANEKSAKRYSDAMVEHYFWATGRYCYPVLSKSVLCTGSMLGPGIIPNHHYSELDFDDDHSRGPLFIDVRDAAGVFKHIIFESGQQVRRELVAQGRWDRDEFSKAAQEYNLGYERGKQKWECRCDTTELQSSIGYDFKTFPETIHDTFEWISKNSTDALAQSLANIELEST